MPIDDAGQRCGSGLRFLAALAATVAFAAPARAGDCVPGAQMACACPGGTQGVQVCAADGGSVEACRCEVEATKQEEAAAKQEDTDHDPCPGGRQMNGGCVPLELTPPPPPPETPRGADPMPATHDPARRRSPRENRRPPDPARRRWRAERETSASPPHTTMLLVGLAGFAAGYATAPAITFGACGGGTAWAGCAEKEKTLIPVAGPFLLLDVADTAGSYVGLMIAAGVVQDLGLVVAIAGLAVPQESAPEVSERGERAMRMTIVPTPGGVAVTGAF